MKPCPTIIIVDDDPDDLLFIQEALEDATKEFTIIPFQYSEVFIDFLSAVSQLPLLVVMDYNMPKLNAEDILLRMKSSQRLASVKVFILSTGMNPSLKERLLALGAYCCIPKPSSAAEYNLLAKDIIQLAATLRKEAEAKL